MASVLVDCLECRPNLRKGVFVLFRDLLKSSNIVCDFGITIVVYAILDETSIHIDETVLAHLHHSLEISNVSFEELFGSGRKDGFRDAVVVYCFHACERSLDGRGIPFEDLDVFVKFHT